MHLFVCNLNAYGCFELHTEPENVVNKNLRYFLFPKLAGMHAYVKTGKTLHLPKNIQEKYLLRDK